MKNRYIYFLNKIFFIIFFFTEVNAQNLNDNHLNNPNLLKINILNLVFGNIDLTYERFIINPKISFSTSLAFNKYPSFFGRETKLFVIIQGLRYYPVTKGIYLGPFIRYTKGQFIKTDLFNNVTPLVITDVSILALGAMVGYQLFVSESFVIDGLIGIGKNRILSKKITFKQSNFTDDDLNQNIGESAYRLGILFGFKF